jgi:hypothetical protein
LEPSSSIGFGIDVGFGTVILPPPVAYRLVDLISRTALAAVAFPKTGANAQRQIIAIAFSI